MSVGDIRILRHAAADHFTILANSVLRDECLSWQATGILAYLLSLPPDWRLRLSHLARQKTNGRDSTRRALSELESLGYLKIEQRRGEDGKFKETVWVVSDKPLASAGFEPRSENPNTAFPETANPDSENLTLQITDRQKNI